MAGFTARPIRLKKIAEPPAKEPNSTITPGFDSRNYFLVIPHVTDRLHRRDAEEAGIESRPCPARNTTCGKDNRRYGARHRYKKVLVLKAYIQSGHECLADEDQKFTIGYLADSMQLLLLSSNSFSTSGPGRVPCSVFQRADPFQAMLYTPGARVVEAIMLHRKSVGNITS